MAWLQITIQARIQSRQLDDIAQPDATEPTKAEILADLRQALKEALSGAGRPAREALAELQRKSIDDADAS